MAGGMAGEIAGMHGDAAPCQALHVGHWRVVVGAGVVGVIFLQDREDTGGSFMAFSAGADRSATDEDTVSIDASRLQWQADENDDGSGR